ncbi:hypothetical protein [Pseudomonas costantinii]|uniref:hypothetical protein n=1 Tax=Pseudomonas costantinii TaxID=168469 RepID=UPI0015A29482|nr:hypothetical protein [Pseudomonas costantinii]NVZ70431.1 hypothetical protein [Pseudomonas costantinii]
MKNFAYYAALPDSMPHEVLGAEFTELLDELESHGIDGAEFAKSLLELSDRQWHTYHVLNTVLKARVEHGLMSIWDGHDLGLVEDVIGVMVRLGLEGINTFLASCSQKDVSPQVFNEILLTLSELHGSVLDPYSGMR